MDIDTSIDPSNVPNVPNVSNVSNVRSSRITILVSSDEAIAIRQAAHLSGGTVSAWLRSLALQAIERVIAERQQALARRTQLGLGERIGAILHPPTLADRLYAAERGLPLPGTTSASMAPAPAPSTVSSATLLRQRVNRELDQMEARDEAARVAAEAAASGSEVYGLRPATVPTPRKAPGPEPEPEPVLDLDTPTNVARPTNVFTDFTEE